MKKRRLAAFLHHGADLLRNTDEIFCTPLAVRFQCAVARKSTLSPANSLARSNGCASSAHAPANSNIYAF